MLIAMNKVAVLPIVIIALMVGCTEKTDDSQSAPVVAAHVADPAPTFKPLSMRQTDFRLKTGMSQNKSCNIESVNGVLFWPDQPSASRTRSIGIVGWIINEESETVPDNVKIRLQTANGVSAWEQDIVMRVDRQDVAKHYAEDAYLKSGFKVDLDIAELTPGEYVVYLAFDSSAGEAICGIGRRFTLTP